MLGLVLGCWEGCVEGCPLGRLDGALNWSLTRIAWMLLCFSKDAEVPDTTRACTEYNISAASPGESRYVNETSLFSDATLVWRIYSPNEVSPRFVCTEGESRMSVMATTASAVGTQFRVTRINTLSVSYLSVVETLKGLLPSGPRSVHVPVLTTLLATPLFMFTDSTWSAGSTIAAICLESVSEYATPDVHRDRTS